jgi:hypothetical protein
MYTSPRTSRTAGEAQRNLPNGAYVLRHILAGLAVAARRRLDQDAAGIAQADRQAVELELGRVLDRRGLGRQFQQLAHAGIEGLGTRGAGIGLGTDRQHRHDMANRREGGQRLAANPLRRRIGGQQFRMRFLERLQFPEQAVVLGVRNGRRIEDVIGVIMALDFGAQRHRARGIGRRRHQENRRRAWAEPAGNP